MLKLLTSSVLNSLSRSLKAGAATTQQVTPVLVLYVTDLLSLALLGAFHAICRARQTFARVFADQLETSNS